MTARDLVRESRSRVTDLTENQTNADVFQFEFKQVLFCFVFVFFKINVLQNLLKNLTEPRLLKTQYLQCSGYVPKCMKYKDSGKGEDDFENSYST